MSWTAEDALKHWEKTGLLTNKKATELKKALTSEQRLTDHGMPKAIAIFATVGAILVGLGVLLFIGSNWSEMTPYQRLATVFLGYGVVAASAYITGNRGIQTVSEALWFLTDVIFGANIILIAQIFHYSLTYWQGPFLWAVGTVAMGYARQHKSHGFLAVPLFILALGWIDSGKGWFIGGQFEFLASDSNLMPVLSILGVGLMSAGLIIRKVVAWNFLAPACVKWGAVLIVFPLLISTMDSGIPKEILTMTGSIKQYLVVGISFVLTALSVWIGDMKKSEPKVFLLTLAALLAAILIQTGDTSGVGVAFEYSPLLYFLYILVIFALSLWVVWVGIIVESSMVVNYGIVVAAIIIIIQYFSWSFALLDRSLAFILGGILLISMTMVVEKKRRKILSSFDT